MSFSSSNHARHLVPSRSMRKVPARVLKLKYSVMPASGSGVVVAHASYRQAGSCVSLPAWHVQPLTDDLCNADIGVLLDEPLIEGSAGFEPVLTSDQWASLLQRHRAAGRPLHLAEVH